MHCLKKAELDDEAQKGRPVVFERVLLKFEKCVR